MREQELRQMDSVYSPKVVCPWFKIRIRKMVLWCVLCAESKRQWGGVPILGTTMQLGYGPVQTLCTERAWRTMSPHWCIGW